MKKKSVALRLYRETLRVMTPESLQEIQGASVVSCTISPGSNTCGPNDNSVQGCPIAVAQ